MEGGVLTRKPGSAKILKSFCNAESVVCDPLPVERKGEAIAVPGLTCMLM